MLLLDYILKLVPDVCSTINVPMSGSCLRRDIKMRSQQQEHTSCVLWCSVNYIQRNSTLIRITQGLHVMNLEYQVIIWSQFKSNIWWKFGGLSMLGPSKHDFGRVFAHCMMGTVPGGASSGLYWNLERMSIFKLHSNLIPLIGPAVEELLRGIPKSTWKK